MLTPAKKANNYWAPVPFFNRPVLFLRLVPFHCSIVPSFSCGLSRSIALSSRPFPADSIRILDVKLQDIRCDLLKY